MLPPPKQVIIIRTDLNMRKGKMVNSGAHASLKAVLDVGFTRDVPPYETEHVIELQANHYLKTWMDGLYKKITVGVGSLHELLDVHARGVAANIPAALILDEGLTEFNGVKTHTACALGPWNAIELDEITGHLKLL